MTLRTAREALGWSQIELDAKASIRRGTVHSIESGANRNPSWQTVAKVMKVLHAAGLTGLTAEDVFGGCGDAVGASNAPGGTT